MKEQRNKGAALAVILLTAATIAALLVMPGLRQRSRPGGYAAFIPLPATAKAAEFSPWELGVRQVKEERGEPTGKQAKVDIPSQLRHYSDSRRFLAVQVAEWREHRFETPQDFTDLAGLIRRKELVELKPVSENYILYGVGGSADKEPFTHYEKSSGERVTLYGEDGLSQEYARIEESRAGLREEVAGLRRELDAAPKRERSRRAELQTRITAKEKTLKAEQESKETLDAYYGDADKRRQLLSAYENLERLAKDFPGQTYAIDEARSRQEMKVRMLSFLRPEALKVLEEIAASYRQKFDRPLPITSLVRPDEYQHLLSKVNPNATRIDTPPHSTGLAFDIYYRYMSAEEQTHVMSDLARLKDEGRIEVLRENRDHYHVFAFIDGGRPGEQFIRESLGKTSASKAQPETTGKDRAAHKEEKRGGGREPRKAEAKKQNESKAKRR